MKHKQKQKTQQINRCAELASRIFERMKKEKTKSNFKCEMVYLID